MLKIIFNILIPRGLSEKHLILLNMTSSDELCCYKQWCKNCSLLYQKQSGIKNI